MRRSCAGARITNSRPGFDPRTFEFRRHKSIHVCSGDISIAEAEAGPIVVARPSTRSVVMGFHPGRSDIRFDLVTPLLLANVLRWFEPDVFRAYDLHGGSAGTVTATLDTDGDPSNVKVLGDQEQLPFTVQGRTVRFFAGTPQTVRIISSGREQVHSLSLPEIASTSWEPPRSAFRGLPGPIARAVSRDLWQYLAVLGAIGLLVEWLVYGRARTRAVAPSATRVTTCRDEAGIMTFDYPWVLFLLVLPIVLLVWDWRKAPEPCRTIAEGRCVSGDHPGARLLPASMWMQRKVATVLLVDTSASLSQSDLQRASKLVTDIEAERGRHWLRVIPFARVLP